MGNAVTLSLFAGLFLSCILIVLYALFGKHRSVFIAIPTTLVFALAITPQILNPGGAGLQYQLLLAVAAAMGIARQFRKVDVDDGARALGCEHE